MLTFLSGKIHRCRVTHADLNYEGSIEIDEDLMDAAGFREYEKVLVANFTNGNRYDTYVTPAPRGSGRIGVNGGGARYSCVGDVLTIFSWVILFEEEEHTPKIVLVNEANRILKVK